MRRASSTRSRISSRRLLVVVDGGLGCGARRADRFLALVERREDERRRALLALHLRLDRDSARVVGEPDQELALAADVPAVEDSRVDLERLERAGVDLDRFAAEQRDADVVGLALVGD